jgi:predicted Zn-dependent protease
MLGRVSARAGQRLPSFLSTHPDPGDREVRTTELSRAAAAGRSGLEVRARAYVQRMDGVVFGPDPRDGFLDGSRYYHPRLEIEMALPEGWQAQDTKQALVAVEPQQAARMQVSLAATEIQGPSEYVRTLVEGGRVANARGAAETVGGFPAWLGRFTVPDGAGGSSVLTAAFVRRDPQHLLQVLGRSAAPGDANDTRIVASARSLRALRDPGRLAARPARVDVVRVAAEGPFREVAATQGAGGASIEELAILNHREPDDTVRRGELLKVVTPAVLR